MRKACMHRIARVRLVSAVPACLLGLLFAAPAAAQSDEPEFVFDSKAAPEESRPDGWQNSFKLGATFSLNHNSHFVGQPDGATYTLGGTLSDEANFNRRQHEWRNTLLLQLSGTRTPLIDRLLKSSDTLDLESVYLFHVEEWWGPFARLSLQTAMLPGHDTRAAPVTYELLRTSGAIDTAVQDRVRLSDAFQPLLLKEAVGAFVQPVRHEEYNLEERLGFGGRETFANGVIAVTDDAATPSVELTELQNVTQAGIESVTSFWGDLSEKRVSYRAEAEFMIPLAHSELPPGDNRNALDLTNIEITGKLSFKLLAWASLDYDLKVLRQPQLLADTWQIQNNLLITIGYSHLWPEPPPAPAPAAEAPPAEAPRAEVEAEAPAVSAEPAPAATPVAAPEEAAAPAEAAPAAPAEPAPPPAAPPGAPPTEP